MWPNRTKNVTFIEIKICKDFVQNRKTNQAFETSLTFFLTNKDEVPSGLDNVKAARTA